MRALIGLIVVLGVALTLGYLATLAAKSPDCPMTSRVEDAATGRLLCPTEGVGK